MSKNKIKAEHFVHLWLEAVEGRKSIGWISEMIGCSDQHVHLMARSLRTSGVKLPKIRRTFVETIDVNKMNQLISRKFGE